MKMEIFVFLTGTILLLIGVLGGGLEVKELKIPRIGWFPRITTIALGFVFILFGIVLDLGKNEIDPVVIDPPDTNTPSIINPTPVHVSKPTDNQMAGLISAIRLADDAEIEARYTLKSDKLYEVFTGEALRTALATVQSLKSNDRCEYATLEGQKVIDYKISPDGQQAEVKLVETWSTIAYTASTQDCLGKLDNHDVPQTVYLKRRDEGWLVEAIVFDSTTSPELQPCN